jgi:hypothetical protein
MGTYTKPRKVPLPKKSKTLPIYGTGDDEDRFFHCWFCGFVCDGWRDELGDSESEAGDDHTDYNSLANANPQLDGAGRRACLGGDIGHYHVAMEIGADSNPKTIRHDLTSDVMSPVREHELER